MPIIESNQLIQVDNSDLVDGTFIVPDDISHVNITAFSGCDRLKKVMLNSVIKGSVVRDWLFHKSASVQVCRRHDPHTRVIRMNIPEFDTEVLTDPGCLPIDSNTYVSVQINDYAMYDELVPAGDDPHAMLKRVIDTHSYQRRISHQAKEFVEYILSLSRQIDQILNFLDRVIVLINDSYQHYHLIQFLHNTYRKIRVCLMELSESEDRNLRGIMSLDLGFHNHEILFNYLMNFISHNKSFLSLHGHYCQLSAKFMQITECIDNLSSHPEIFELYQSLILRNQLSLQAASMVTMRVSLLIRELESCFAKLNQLQSFNESILRDIHFLSGAKVFFEKRASDSDNAPYFPIKRGPGSSRHSVIIARRKQRDRVRSMGKSHSSKELQDMAKSLFVDPRSNPEPIYKSLVRKKAVIILSILVGIPLISFVVWELIKLMIASQEGGFIIGTMHGRMVNYSFSGAVDAKYLLDANSTYRIIPNTKTQLDLTDCVLNHTENSSVYYCEAPGDQHQSCFGYLSNQCLWGYFDSIDEGYVTWHQDHWHYCAAIQTHNNTAELVVDINTTLTFSGFELGVTNSTGQTAVTIEQAMGELPIEITIPAGYVGLSYSPGTVVQLIPHIAEEVSLPSYFDHCEVTVCGPFGSKVLKVNESYELDGDDVRAGSYSLGTNIYCPVGGDCSTSPTSMRDGEFKRASLFGCQSGVDIYKYDGQSLECEMAAGNTFRVPQF